VLRLRDNEEGRAIGELHASSHSSLKAMKHLPVLALAAFLFVGSAPVDAEPATKGWFGFSANVVPEGFSFNPVMRSIKIGNEAELARGASSGKIASREG
jgi:hypothetical protein